MKPTVISNPNPASTGSDSMQTGGNGVTIPINHEYRSQSTDQHQQPQLNTLAQHYITDEPQVTSYGSPNTFRDSQRQQPHPLQQRETPAHFQRDFHFEPDADMATFPRTRLGRMAHDPFGDFGGTTRKRTSLHDPQFLTDGFSGYFNDALDFDFPQFNSLGRRRINDCNDDDFFNRLPSDFRQYIPESFTHRRAGSGMTGNSGMSPTIVLPQQTPPQSQTNVANTLPISPLRKVCDASIQTEDPAGHSEVDNLINTENLYQYGLRNTMDMGMKSPSENENQAARSSSAPPTEKQKQPHSLYNQPQQISVNNTNHPIAPTQQQQQFDTQTNPQLQLGGYCAQVHPPEKRQTPPPQTPGGSYIRTIPIFVEGRSEPIINNMEIPNEKAAQTVSPDSGNSRGFTPPKQQAHRLRPLNTQKALPNRSSDPPPQTPHTVDTINKIQDIQRDVLNLMSRVEKFTGTRVDKEYVYLDEMLTRNLLKLDNIETNGKESIRLARKEAIKCIQASINVLEAKAEENKKLAQMNPDNKKKKVHEVLSELSASPVQESEVEKSTSIGKVTKELMSTTAVDLIVNPIEKLIDEPIPLPPPEIEKFNEVKIEDCPEDDVSTTYITEESTSNPESTHKNNLSETK